MILACFYRISIINLVHKSTPYLILFNFNFCRQVDVVENTIVVAEEKEVWDVRSFVKNVIQSGEHLQITAIKNNTTWRNVN